jgi:hypothetical protein
VEIRVFLVLLSILLSGCSSSNAINPIFDCKFADSSKDGKIRGKCISDTSLDKVIFEFAYESIAKNGNEDSIESGQINRLVNGIQSGVAFPISFYYSSYSDANRKVSFRFKVRDATSRLNPFSAKVSQYISSDFKVELLANPEPKSEWPTQSEDKNEVPTQDEDLTTEATDRWYEEGYAAIMDRDPETLNKWGIRKAFGATGNPVKSKMLNFCYTFTVWELEPNRVSDISEVQKIAARKFWNMGCVEAGMSLRLP